MSEMVERVARAMFEDDQFDYEPRMPTWEETGVREEYRRKARIAIGAMRDPTEAMIDAGLVAEDVILQSRSGSAVPSVWETMIDAASDETMR